MRYWNGASWVPGTSRPAPAAGEPLPAPNAHAPSAPSWLRFPVGKAAVLLH
ncbi:DUF2510 domain-containing protein [Nocardia salmonicida]|uniref:DUF2510 domain-containing protein n=1 Tax=Nocardia salmonicida TaxID=53431 RepID=UPI00365251F3